MKKVATINLALLALVNSAVLMPVTSVAQQSVIKQDMSHEEAIRALKVSSELAQDEAARLLLYATLLNVKLGDLVSPSEEIQNKYNDIAKSAVGAVQVGLLTVGTGYAVKSSADQVKSVLAPVQQLIVAVGRVLEQIAEEIGRISSTGFVAKMFEASGDSLEAVAKAVAPLIKSSLTGEVAVVSGTGLLSSATGASLFLGFNNVDTALKRDIVRKALGYEKDLNTQLDSKLTRLGSIFNLSQSKQEQLKDAVVKSLVEQGKKQKFSRTAKYNVDILTILENENIVSKQEVQVAKGLQAIFDATTNSRKSAAEIESLITNIGAVSALTAILEAQLDRATLSEDEQNKLSALVANANKTLKTIKTNSL